MPSVDIHPVLRTPNKGVFQMLSKATFTLLRRSLVFALAVSALPQNSHRDLETTAKAAVSQIEGTLEVRGLRQPVNVLRDRWGVAHIYAQNQHDLFFAQGFVVAQDRLFQMELWRRSGQGRLAEIVGPSALFRDINARLLMYRGDMKGEFESYSPDTKEILEAFTSGINAYIGDRQKPGGAGLPVEFQIAGFTPEPWKPEDCLNRMAAFSMTGNAFSELQHAEVVANVGADKASRLFHFDPAVKLDPAPGLDFSGLSAGLLRNLVGSDTRIDLPPYYMEGSNNWTVSGALTKSGKPALANDPHRVLAEPSLRYMVHLVAPGWDVIGAGEPALPGVALGHNQNIAWGFTIFGSDQQDLYVEELNPSDTLQYRTEHGWERMRVEKQSFAIRGGPPVTVELKFTRHGPVLWQDHARATALRWVGSEPGTAGYLGSLAVDRAQNWKEFEAAVSRWKLPTENIVYADREGNIGEHSVGLTPIRKNWTGLLPMPGAGGYEWAGFVPLEELPHSFNPEKGFVATANNKVTPEGYPYKIGYGWYPSYRVDRISEVFDQARVNGHKLDIEDMQRLQSDAVSIPGRQLVQLLREAVDDRTTVAERLLLKWDGVLDKDSAGAALYEVYLKDLKRAVVHRAAPQRIWSALEDWEPNQLFSFLEHPAADVFGSNPETERNRLLRDSLQAAADQLAKLQGAEPGKWAWGRMHVVRFRHPLDNAPGLKTLLDLGPIPRSGDADTVGATGYYGESFDQVEGASYRQIFDLSDWDKAVAINAPGQSGQPGSRHYSDLLPLWSDWQYFPLLYSAKAVESTVTDRLLLQP
jgi:penicillin amidase